jgi:hypothetical protein
MAVRLDSWSSLRCHLGHCLPGRLIRRIRGNLVIVSPPRILIPNAVELAPTKRISSPWTTHSRAATLLPTKNKRVRTRDLAPERLIRLATPQRVPPHPHQVFQGETKTRNAAAANDRRASEAPARRRAARTTGGGPTSANRGPTSTNRGPTSTNRGPTSTNRGPTRPSQRPNSTI